MPDLTEQNSENQRPAPPTSGSNRHDARKKRDDEITDGIDSEVRLLAAIAYGEASIDDNPDEVLGIAYAVANRSRAWGGKKVPEMIQADPGYTYAADGTNVRFNLLMKAPANSINKSSPMRIAVKSAIAALKQEGYDPSNGAFWWDGVDLKDMRKSNMRITRGFKYGANEHNIFDMQPITKTVVRYWQVKNKKTGEIVNTAERGRYEAAYVSTAARGKTIFWLYAPDYVKATGAKEYK